MRALRSFETSGITGPMTDSRRRRLQSLATPLCERKIPPYARLGLKITPTVLGDVTLCSLADGSQRFGEICYRCFQGALLKT